MISQASLAPGAHWGFAPTTTLSADGPLTFKKPSASDFVLLDEPTVQHTAPEGSPDPDPLNNRPPVLVPPGEYYRLGDNWEGTDKQVNLVTWNKKWHNKSHDDESSLARSRSSTRSSTRLIPVEPEADAVKLTSPLTTSKRRIL